VARLLTSQFIMLATMVGMYTKDKTHKLIANCNSKTSVALAKLGMISKSEGGMGKNQSILKVEMQFRGIF